MSERAIVTPEVFAAAGYKPFRDGMKEGRFYEGSWQKRIDDERGKRYFITVALWQFRDGPMSASADCQFHDQDDMRGEFCNVTQPMDEGIEATEAFFARKWDTMGFGYYELWSWVDPTALTPSPAYRPQDGKGV